MCLTRTHQIPADIVSQINLSTETPTFVLEKQDEHRTVVRHGRLSANSDEGLETVNRQKAIALFIG